MPGKMAKKSNIDMDEQFDTFMKESISSEDSSFEPSQHGRYFPEGKNKKKEKPWWSYHDADDDDDIGLTGTGKNFLKKKTADPAPLTNGPTSKAGNLVNSKDSLDDESFTNHQLQPKNPPAESLVPALSLGSSHSYTETGTVDKFSKTGDGTLGEDTLNELAEKENFFKSMEKRSDSTIDYSQLNKDLDYSETGGATLFNAGGRGAFTYQTGADLESSSEVDKIGFTGKQSKEDRESMLGKVALESLESTLDTKPAASRDALNEDMMTIPETNREYENLTPKDESQKDDIDGHSVEKEEDGSAENKISDSATNKGLTLKTGTGLMFTDTSREMAAYEQALRKAGMSTLDDDFTLKESASALKSTQKHEVTVDDTSMQGTGAFGMKPLAPKDTDDSGNKSIGDIRYGAGNLERVRADNELAVRFHDQVETRDDMKYGSMQGTDTRGFDLSPAHTGRSEDPEGYDMSPIEKYASGPDFNLAPWNQDYDDALSASPPVPARRQKNVPEDKHQSRPREKKKKAYANVPSSGYGRKFPETKSPNRLRSSTERSPSPQKTSTPNNRRMKPGQAVSKSRSRSNSNQRNQRSPQGQRNKIKDVSPIRPKKKTPSGVYADPESMSSAQLFAAYFQHRSPNGTLEGSGNERPKHELKLSKEEPIMSSSQKSALLAREKELVLEIRDWQEQWKEERKINAKLKVELVSIEKEHLANMEKLKMDYDQQIKELKQENFVLTAKLNDKSALRPPLKDLGSKPVKKPDAKYDSDDSAREEKQQLAEASEEIDKLQKEVRELENLLSGYQQENKRAYEEMKRLQANSKAGEQGMFQANQRLNMELNQLRDELVKKEAELKSRSGFPTESAPVSENGAVLGAGKIAQLQVELKQSKARETNLKDQINTLSQTNKALEAHIETLVGKVEACEEKSAVSSSKKVKELQEKHEKEVERLNRKLKWFAENQELLDRDKASLIAKDNEIQALKAKLDHLKSEDGKKQAEARAKAKERSADAKKIQDLERQVKEMENIIKKRHPNSLPVLMWAANSAPSAAEQASQGSKPPSMYFLENRIKSLEAELEKKDEEDKQGLRLLEQKYNMMKFQYEERINALESQLQSQAGHNHLKEGDHPHTHAVALQRELDVVRERHRKKVAELELSCEGLRKEVAALKNKEGANAKSGNKSAREAESDLQLRVKALQMELSNQLKERSQMQAALEKAEKEKQQVLADLARVSERSSRDKSQPRSRPGSGKSRGKGATANGKRSSRGEEPNEMQLPPYPEAAASMKEKLYEPTTFAGQHISEIVRENEELRVRVERLQLEAESQHVQLQKVAAEAEARERAVREEAEDQLSALRAAHQQELQRLLLDHAAQHASSKTAELQGRVDTQEVMIKHLKDQARHAELERDQLSACKVRCTALETEISKLKDELAEARRCHAPEMRHYEALKSKIQDMESKHLQRERDLQQIIKNSHQAASIELSEEVDRWKKIVEAKNRETEKFRLELDAILDMLKELQRQGVVLPNRSAAYHR